MSQYRPCLERWGDYAAAALCKPHIFHSAYLLNTEIIITILSKSLIKSAQTVRTVTIKIPDRSMPSSRGLFVLIILV